MKTTRHHAARQRTTRRRTIVPFALVAALTVAACSQGETAEFETTAQQTPAAQAAADAAQEATTEEATEEATADDTAAEATDVTNESAAAAGINPVTVPDAIATVTVPAHVDGDPEATLDVSIHSLTREGKTLMGVFSFTYNSSTDDDKSVWLYDLLRNQTWSPHLVDTENLTRHDVLSVDATHAKTDSQGSTYLRPGHTTYAYAAFASPPEGVESMMVSLTDGSQAVEVPIQ